MACRTFLDSRSRSGMTSREGCEMQIDGRASAPKVSRDGAATVPYARYRRIREPDGLGDM
ncbi:MAG: hypothetical protein ACYC0V_10805 [Armatimonadota bacterium]